MRGFIFILCLFAVAPSTLASLPNFRGDSDPARREQNRATAAAIDALPQREPFAVNTFRVDANAHIAVAPDGRTAFVVERFEAVRIWNVLVYHWRIALGVPLGGICLWLLWRMARHLQHPRAVGEPHCRRCNYQLTGSVSDTCVECGADLKRARAIVVGQSVRGRIIAGTTLLILLPGTFVALHKTLPQYPTAMLWFDWHSRSLHEYASERKVGWLLKHDCWYQSVHEFDPATGAVGRRVFAEPIPTWWTSVVFSGDGSTMVASNRECTVQWNIAERRVVRSWDASVWPTDHRMRTKLGQSPALLLSHDGEHLRLKEVEDVTIALATGRPVVIDGQFPLRGADRPLYAAFSPPDVGMSTAARPRIRISGAFGEMRHIDAPPGLFASTMSRPARTFSERFVIIRNRSQLAMSLNSDDCIGVWDLDTGELVERITSPRIHGERILGSSASGRYLLVHAADWRGHVAGARTRAPMTYRIAIYDLMRGRWIAACLVPSDHAMRDIHLWLAPGDAELVMQSTLDSGEELLLRWNVADVTSE